MLSKAKINWLFNDIWCYLFIAFDWRICFFQQTVVKVYHILKKKKKKVSKWTTDKTNVLAEVADISFDNAPLLRSQKIY